MNCGLDPNEFTRLPQNNFMSIMAQAENGNGKEDDNPFVGDRQIKGYLYSSKWQL